MAYMNMHRASQTATLATSWRDILIEETIEIEQAGVQAAIVSVRLVCAEHELENDARRAESLLRRRLHLTDRVGATREDALAVLLSPTVSLTQTVEQVRSLSSALDSHRIPTFTAFAHRRPDEPLLSTWARAEAEIDRSIYRSEHAAGIRLQ